MAGGSFYGNGQCCSRVQFSSLLHCGTGKTQHGSSAAQAYYFVYETIIISPAYMVLLSRLLISFISSTLVLYFAAIE